MNDSQVHLFEALVTVPIPQGLNTFQVVDTYLRATLVAAGVPFKNDILQSLLLQIAKYGKEGEQL